jgi:hypothetical protein
MKQARILMALPVMNRLMDVKCVMGQMSVLAAAGGEVMPFYLAGNSNISDARNQIAHHFMEHTNCEHLFCVDADIGFTLQDYHYLMEGTEDIVIAPYSRKSFGELPVDFGFGFCRISRKAFATLRDWMTEDGQEALPRYRMKGEIAVHYFFTGAMPDMRWMGEDTGFFHWCALNNISMRQERRTTLLHIGAYEFPYPPQSANDAAAQNDEGAQ